MNKRTIIISVGVLLVLIGGIFWAVRGRADAKLEKVRAMGKELFSGNGPPDREKMGEFMRARRELSPDQQDQLHAEGEQRMNERLAGFFKLSPQEQTAFLDERIQEDEKRRREWESRRQDQPRPPQARPAGGANGNASPARRNRTLEERLQARNKRLDRATPEQRAQRTAFRAAMDKRRKELGLPSGRPPFGPRMR
jgi:hypothetical protein